MRILHLIGAGKPGGAETFAVRLMGALARHGLAQRAVVRRQGWVGAQLRSQNIACEDADFGGFFDQHWPWGTHRVVGRVVGDFAPDVVFGWMSRGAVFMPQTKALQGVRVARLGGFYDLKHYRGRVDWLVGNTPAICDHCVAQGWPANRVQLIENFTLAPPSGWQAQREAQRVAWGWTPSDLGVIQMGRLHTVKGADVALEAMALLPGHVKLALVGEGPLAGALRDRVAQLGLAGRVVLPGWMDAPHVAAAAADVWIAPSRHEPFGNTVLDAWAHGVPVVASAVGGMAALVRDGDSGLAVPPEDAPALAAAIGRLSHQSPLRATVVRGGTKAWQEGYSEDKIVADYVRFFEQMLLQHKAPQ